LRRRGEGEVAIVRERRREERLGSRVRRGGREDGGG